MPEITRKEIISTGIRDVGFLEKRVPNLRGYIVFGPKVSGGFLFVTSHGSVRHGMTIDDSKSCPALADKFYRRGMGVISRERRKKGSKEVQGLLEELGL